MVEMASRYSVKSLSLLVPFGKLESVVQRILQNSILGRRIGGAVAWMIGGVVKERFDYNNVSKMATCKAERVDFIEALEDGSYDQGRSSL